MRSGIQVSDVTSETTIEIKDINITAIADLSDFPGNLSTVKTIGIIDNPELDIFNIHQPNNLPLPKLETLNFRRNPKLKTVNVSEQTTLKRITFDKKNQLKTFETDGCFSLSEIDFDQDFTLQSPAQLERFSTKDCKELSIINLNNSTKLNYINCSNCFALKELYLDGTNNLETLNLSACTSLEDTKLYLPGNLNSLTNIDLSGCTGLREKIVDIIQLSANARIIDIGGCERITAADIEDMYLAGNDRLETLVLPQHLAQELTELDLSDCSSLIKLDFKPESRNLSFDKLKTLNLAGTKLSVDEIIKIVKLSPNIETLDLSGCKLNDSDIRKILTAIPERGKEKLKILNLGQILDLNILPLKWLKPFSALEEINLAGSGLQNFTGDGISLPKLTKIDLSGCKISGDNIAKITYKAKSLKKLIIDADQADISQIIENTEELKELRIRNYQKSGLDLKGFSNLEILDLSDSSQLSTLGLGKFPFLKQLSLSGSAELTKSPTINKIIASTLLQEGTAKISTLEKIDLGGANLSDAQLQQIFQNGLTRLRNLSLSGLKIKPIGNDNRTLTISGTLTNLSRIDLKGANLTSLSIENSGLKEVDCSNCTSLKSLQSDPELQNLQNINFQGCKELPGNIIFDFIGQSLPNLKVLNLIGCKDISLEDIEKIFAENKIEQLYIDQDLKHKICEKVKAGELKLPDSLLILSSDFDKDNSSRISENGAIIQSSEINQLRLQYELISQRLERLEASTIVTILPGELEIKDLERVQQERKELCDGKLYQEFMLQFSAMLRITQLTSNPNIAMTNIVADTTATTATKVGLRRIPVVGIKLAEELSKQKAIAGGEDIAIQKLYCLTKEESLNALTDCLARTLLLNPEITAILEKLSSAEIITKKGNQSDEDSESQVTDKTSKIDEMKAKAADTAKKAIQGLKSKAEILDKSSKQHTEDTESQSSTSSKIKSATKAGGSRIAASGIKRIVDAIERPEDLANRYSNYRHKESDEVDHLMVSLLSSIFSQPIKKDTPINYELVENLTRIVKQDLQKKLSKQEEKQKPGRSRSSISISSDQPSSSNDLSERPSPGEPTR
jgi:uncharacterized protein YjbI with pentapeptide repeats